MTDPHGQNVAVTDDHATDGGEHDEPAALGPIDVDAWLAATLGIALGLVVALCLVIAVSLP